LNKTSMNAVAARPGKRAVAVRVLTAIFGSYAFTYGAVACVARLLASTGMNRAEAVLAASMAGFPLYLALLVYGFAARSLTRLMLLLFGGGALLVGLAFLRLGGT
jgi:hypothetical protein